MYPHDVFALRPPPPPRTPPVRMPVSARASHQTLASCASADDALLSSQSTLAFPPSNKPARHTSLRSNLSHSPLSFQSSDDTLTKHPTDPSLELFATSPVDTEHHLPLPLHRRPTHHHRPHDHLTVPPTIPARRWGMGKGLRICCFIFCFLLGALASLAVTVLYLFDLRHEVLFDVVYPLGGLCCFLGLGFLMSYIEQLRIMFKPVSIVPSIFMIGSFIMIGVSAHHISVFFAVIFNGVMDIAYILYAISVAPSVQRFFKAPLCFRR